MKRFVVRLTVWAMALIGVLASVMVPSSASAAPPPPGGYVSLTPTRLLDTRSGVGAPKAAVAARGTVSLRVTGKGGVPSSGVSAVVLNVTAVSPTASGFITVFGSGSRPTVSNVNFLAGQVVPNLVIVPVSNTGTVKLYNGSSGVTHMLADVAGYYRSGTPATPGAFGALTPTRLLDTRSGSGAPKARVAAKARVSLKVTGRGNVPASGVSAVVLNVTAVSPTRSGFITAFGQGGLPTVSNVNFLAGQIVPNLVIVPVSDTGTVNLYNGSSGTTDLLADVAGYYLSGAPVSTGAFGAVTPTRLLDTRSGIGATKAPVAARGTVTLTVTGRGGVPATGVAAVVLNVTATQTTRPGFITAYGPGARPVVSNLNFLVGQTVPNLVVVPVSDTGTVKFFNGSAGTTHLLADVAGYYRADTAPVPVTNLHSTAITSSTVALAWTNPTNPDFTGVVIRRAVGATAPATRTDGVQVVDANAPANSHTDTGLTAGTHYSYAAFAHDAVPNDAAAATLTVTTAPGPVTNLTATPSSATKVQVQLAWTNPSNASFTGVMIRRALGASAPATVTDGQLVVTDQATSPYVDDVGLVAETQYSYSVFAHDTAGSSSVATTVTVTTLAGPTTAVLSVNGSTGATAQTSVGGFEPTFVATGSSASPGETIVSGSLNYGDGTTQDFTGPVAGWDPFHTFATTGARTVTLTVTDSADTSETDVVTVTVFAAPTATISSTGGDAGVPISFDTSTTTPATTAFTDYEVDFGDGKGLEFSVGVPPATVTHTYAAAGSYTVTFSAFNDADGIANANTQVSITQPPVTALSTSSVTATSITLVWTNPVNPAFTGVTVRRAVGATAPANPAAGVAVPVPATPTTVSFTDTGLTAGTTYSYAVFAHDGVPVNSVAATVTETTTTPAGAVPIAALSINNSTGATAKASLNGFLAKFDLTGTQASVGETINTASLDYGDGTTPADFTGDDPSQWSADHEYATVGGKTATLKVTDSGGGIATTVVTVTVFDQPSATISGPATAQTDAIVTFNLAGVTPPGTAFTDWEISVDGIQVAFSDVGAPPATFPWHFDVADTYHVTLSVFNDADGDATSVPITLTVN